MKIGNIELTRVFPKGLIDKIDFWIKAKRISSTDQEGGTRLIFLVTDNGNGNVAIKTLAISNIGGLRAHYNTYQNVDMEMVRNLGDHGVIVSEDVHGKRVEVEYSLDILVSTDDTESNDTDTPEPTTTITEITMGGLRFKAINIVSLFPEIRTSTDWNFEKSFRIVQPGVYHDDTVFRVRIYPLGSTRSGMTLLSVDTKRFNSTEWTNILTEAYQPYVGKVGEVESGITDDTYGMVCLHRTNCVPAGIYLARYVTRDELNISKVEDIDNLDVF